MMPPLYWKTVFLRFFATEVVESDLDALVEECHLPHTADDGLDCRTPCVSSKMSGSAQNLMVVPVRLAGLPFFSLAVGVPYANDWIQWKPSRTTSTSSRLGQRIHHRNPNTVETTRDRVGARLRTCRRRGAS